MTFRALNHFVPELYLKRFSEDGIKVFEYRTVVKHEKVPIWNPVAIRKLARLKHLYSFVDEDADGVIDRSDHLEKFFDSQFEAPAEEAIQRAVCGDCMTPDHWRKLAWFFGLQLLRTPAHYIHTRNWWSSNMKQATESYTEALKQMFPSSPPPPEVLREVEKQFLTELGIPLTVIDESKPDENQIRLRFNSVIGRRAWLVELKRQLAANGIARGLADHKWTVLRAPAGEMFVTSDRPAVNIHKVGPKSWEFGAGWYQPGAVLYMPLSPHCLLFTQVGQPRISRDFVLTTEKLREVNRTMVAGAMRSILALRPLDYVEAIRPRQVNFEKATREELDFANWDEAQTLGDLNR
ncbi:DUF4238 domain-containing protein [Terriglobus aquaticus]|uniref:DUF4238 domain-containing protein n=1 Tax=Terriglobus aquaticus TaxID=940139 RepID=A0ABW9KQL5_9BACT|nr:DUF4238 domain-containing protein [Terriglobus aquaticus]